MLAKSLCLALVIVMTLGCVAGAQSAPPQARNIKSIESEVAAARAAYRSAAENGSEAQLEELAKTYNQKLEAGWASALEIAKADPQSETAFEALQWIVRSPGSADPQSLLMVFAATPGSKAIDLLTKHHAANPRIGSAVAILAYYPPQLPAGSRAAYAPFEAVVEKNPDRIVAFMDPQGDLMLLHTDGSEDYVSRRLERKIREVKHESAAEIFRTVTADMRAFSEPSDDVSLVVIKRVGEPIQI
jgi:hypothetical protein